MIPHPIRRSRFHNNMRSVLILTILGFSSASSLAQIVQPTTEALAELDRVVQAYLNENQSTSRAAWWLWLREGG